jgi:hypothetical protein
VIQLNEATHVYTLEGRVVPSVTQALSMITKAYQFVTPEVLEAARIFGNHVHTMIDWFNRGELDEETLEPELVRYLFQYKRFLHQTRFAVTESERIVYNATNRYAGKFDMGGKWKRATWLLDLKSGLIPITVGPQTEAYRRAHPEPPQRRAVLQLARDRFTFRELDAPQDWTMFLSALNCYRFLNKHLERGPVYDQEEDRRAGSAAS